MEQLTTRLAALSRQRGALEAALAALDADLLPLNEALASPADRRRRREGLHLQLELTARAISRAERGIE